MSLRGRRGARGPPVRPLGRCRRRFATSSPRRDRMSPVRSVRPVRSARDNPRRAEPAHFLQPFHRLQIECGQVRLMARTWDVVAPGRRSCHRECGWVPVEPSGGGCARRRIRDGAPGCEGGSPTIPECGTLFQLIGAIHGALLAIGTGAHLWTAPSSHGPERDRARSWAVVVPEARPAVCRARSSGHDPNRPTMCAAARKAR